MKKLFKKMLESQDVGSIDEWLDAYSNTKDPFPFEPDDPLTKVLMNACKNNTEKDDVIADIEYAIDMLTRAKNAIE